MIRGGRVKYDMVDDGIEERKQDRICEVATLFLKLSLS